MAAAITSYAILFLVYFSASFIPYVPETFVPVVRYISTLTHAANFSVGLITLADAVYYLSGIGLCLVLTRISVENRLW